MAGTLDLGSLCLNDEGSRNINMADIKVHTTQAAAAAINNK